MRTSVLLLALVATVVLAPSAEAQRTVKSWYQLKSGDRVEFVQAATVSMKHLKDRTQVMADGKEVTMGGRVSIAFAGTGEEPQQPQARGGRSGSTSASGGDFRGGGSTHTDVEVVIDADGTSHTKTTTTRTEVDGSQTTTTTTTTTTTDGETTSETTTEQK